MIPAGYHEGGDDNMTNIEAYVSTRKDAGLGYKYDKEFKGQPIPKADVTKQKWDSIRKGSKNKRKITAPDVTKLRDIATNVFKENRGKFLVAIDDKNNFQLIHVGDKDRQKIPDEAIVGSLPYLYDSLVKGNAPADDKFFTDMKNKTQTDLEQKKQSEMNKGFQEIQEIDKKLPSIPFERKTFFKQ